MGDENWKPIARDHTGMPLYASPPHHWPEEKQQRYAAFVCREIDKWAERRAREMEPDYKAIIAVVALMIGFPIAAAIWLAS